MTNCDHSNGWMDLPEKCSTTTEPMITWHETVYPQPPVTEPDAFEAKVQGLFDQAAELLLSKHHDYGPLNIALSPGGPVNGLRVRLHDKLARLNHLVDSGAEPQHESLEDTWRDIIGYGAIGLLVSRGDWPSE